MDKSMQEANSKAANLKPIGRIDDIITSKQKGSVAGACQFCIANNVDYDEQMVYVIEGAGVSIRVCRTHWKQIKSQINKLK